jgi:hypothetical protein
MGGVAALQRWFGSLTREENDEIAPHKAALLAAAQQVDAAANAGK